MSEPEAVGRGHAVAEIFLIFAVFFTQGAWPVPDVNEPYYLGKAIHFWNPQWVPDDFFLQTPDAHEVFCYGFGWLSLWLSPAVLAWTGRLVTWGLLAWSWRRMSWVYVPRRWAAVVSAAVFACLQERFHMAGEWVIGGVEAKGFAFVLVFLALEAMGRNRWNRTWLLLGAASAWHVLVGGWATIAALLCWASLREDRPRLGSMALALVAGFLVSLAGLVPALNLTAGADPETVARAYQIYVFGRLGHHLTPLYIPWTFLYRFLGLIAFWILLERAHPADRPRRRLRGFVGASVGIAAVGMGINLLVRWDQAKAAALLRFYWFRLSDMAVPMGVALLAGPAAARWWEELRRWWPDGGRWRRAAPAAALAVAMLLLGALLRLPPWGPGGTPLPWALTLLGGALVVGGLFWISAWSLPLEPDTRRIWLGAPLGAAAALVLLAAAVHLGNYFQMRLRPTIPRADRLYQYPRPEDRLRDYRDWRDVCSWIANSGQIPRDARFLTPRVAQTFKWYARRPEVVNWKETPQDPKSIVQWWDRLHDIYGSTDPQKPWVGSLAELGADRLRELGKKYDADYALTRTWPWVNGLKAVYWNRDDPKGPLYVVYQLRPDAE